MEFEEEEEIGWKHNFTLSLEDLEKWNWRRKLTWQYYCLFGFPIFLLGRILIFGKVDLVVFILKKRNKGTPSLFFLILEFCDPKHIGFVTLCPLLTLCWDSMDDLSNEIFKTKPSFSVRTNERPRFFECHNHQILLVKSFPMLSRLIVVLGGNVKGNTSKMLWCSGEDCVTMQKYLFP